MTFVFLSQVTLTTFKRILRTPRMSGETSEGQRGTGREVLGQEKVRRDRWEGVQARKTGLGAPYTVPDIICPAICSPSVALHNTQ